MPEESVQSPPAPTDEERFQQQLEQAIELSKVENDNKLQTEEPGEWQLSFGLPFGVENLIVRGISVLGVESVTVRGRQCLLFQG